jgi:hypothetical protein
MGSRWLELRLGYCEEGSGRGEGEGMEQRRRLCRSGWVAELLDRWWRNWRWICGASQVEEGERLGNFSSFLPGRGWGRHVRAVAGMGSHVRET